MLRTSNHKRSLQIMVMVLALLVASITATGYADLGPTEQLSGPALVGTLTLFQVGTDVAIQFVGKCRGNDLASPISLFQTDFTVATTTAKSLEGYRLIGAGPSDCLVKDGGGGEDLIVNTVVAPKFVKTGTQITANVVLLHVVPL